MQPWNAFSWCNCPPRFLKYAQITQNTKNQESNFFRACPRLSQSSYRSKYIRSKLMGDMSAAVFIFFMCACVCIPVKGAWSCWSSWSQCSVGCGGGHYQRTRSCNSPAPANGGDICIGLHTEEALCNTHTCDGKVTRKFKIELHHATTARDPFITPPGMQSPPTPCHFCFVRFTKWPLSSFPNE